MHRRFCQGKILSVKSINGGIFSAGDNGVSLDTNNGRLLISLEDYIARIKLDSPNHVIAMADEVSYFVGKKRFSTAIRRTQAWFVQLQGGSDLNWDSSSLIGVIIGKSDLKLSESIAAQTEFLVSRGAGGLLIGGIGLGESLDDRRDVINLVKEARQGRVCPLYVQGLQTLDEVCHSTICTDIHSL
jgi:queuine/archaeosine tRNA-ribosyltransferase